MRPSPQHHPGHFAAAKQVVAEPASQFLNHVYATAALGQKVWILSYWRFGRTIPDFEYEIFSSSPKIHPQWLTRRVPNAVGHEFTHHEPSIIHQLGIPERLQLLRH